MLSNRAPGLTRLIRRKRSRIGLLSTLYSNSSASTTGPGKDSDSARIILNVSGRRFETDRWTLRTFADTRLAWMATNPTAHQEYDSVKGEFVIDRHAGCFEFILNFYRTGKLHMPTDVCGPLFEDELNYWGIDERLMEPCCWSRYKTYRDTEDRMRKMLRETQQQGYYGSDGSDVVSLSEGGGGRAGVGRDESAENNHAILHNIIDFLDDETEKRENRLLYYWKKLRKILWRVFDSSVTNRSVAAKVYTTISLTMIGIYISVFCLETIDEFRVPKPQKLSRPPSNNETLLIEDTVIPSMASIVPSGSPLRYRSRTDPHMALVVLDYLCISFFTLELIATLAVCPKPLKMFKSFLTWVDIATIIPLYFVMVFESFAKDESTILIIELVKSIKILRILLIFKIANNFTGVRVLWYTFRASAKELVMLIFFLGIGVLFSGVLIYYAETMFGTRQSEFSSIPIGFWWGLVTMTTLGYGDFYPRTLPGYIVGASCAIIGVLVIALPIPVIVNNFTVYYAHAQALSSMPARPRVVLAASAARRLQSIPTSIAYTIASDGGVAADQQSVGGGALSTRPSLAVKLSPTLGGRSSVFPVYKLSPLSQRKKRTSTTSTTAGLVASPLTHQPVSKLSSAMSTSSLNTGNATSRKSSNPTSSLRARPSPSKLVENSSSPNKKEHEKSCSDATPDGGESIPLMSKQQGDNECDKTVTEMADTMVDSITMGKSASLAESEDVGTPAEENSTVDGYSAKAVHLGLYTPPAPRITPTTSNRRLSGDDLQIVPPPHPPQPQRRSVTQSHNQQSNTNHHRPSQVVGAIPSFRLRERRRLTFASIPDVEFDE